MKLADLLSRFAEVVTERDGFTVPCPAHSDSHPSLRIAASATGKVLLKCRAGCSTPSVLSALGLSFADLDAIDTADVPAFAASTSKPASPSAVAALAADLDRWVSNLIMGGDEAADYARDRFGLSDDDIARLGLGYAAGLGGGPRLVVPFRDVDGVPRGYQARAIDPDARVRWLGAKSPDGESWARVGWLPGVSGWAEVVITEGPGDGLTACAIGYDTVMVRGAALASTVAEEIAAMVNGRPVVVCGDADSAGDRFARVLAAGLARLGLTVRKVRPPRDGDDLTDWRGRNPAGFAEAFTRAVSEAATPGGLTDRLDAWTDADLTELATARRLREYLESQGSGVKYSPEAGFFILDAGVWRADKLDTVRTAAQAVAGAICDEAEALGRELAQMIAMGDPDKEADKLKGRVNKLRSFAQRTASSRGLDAMVRELKALPGTATNLADFDQHSHLLAVRNGVIDLRTGELMPHDPSLLLTRRIEQDYDPNATAPRWEQFLREVFPRDNQKGMPDYIRRLVGYGITGETSEQCFAVLWGPGANGKSVFTDTLTRVFRELTVTTPFSTFEEKTNGGIPNDIAALRGSRLVMASEGEAGKPMAESVLKRVTGRDLISARFMRQEFFEFAPTFLLMMATNHRPKFRGQDDGLWRRVKLINWDRRFAPHERDHKLGDKLLAESPGILAWAVRGAVEWYRDGLADPSIIVNATAEYRQNSDALGGLFPGTFVKEEGAKILAKTAWDSYRHWTEEEALPMKERWTRGAFFAALEERGAIKKRESVGTVFSGIRLARPSDAAADKIGEESSAEDRAGDAAPDHSPSDRIGTVPNGPSLSAV